MSFEEFKTYESNNIPKEKMENKDNPENNKKFIENLDSLSDKDTNNLSDKLTNTYLKHEKTFSNTPEIASNFTKEYQKTKGHIDKPLDTSNLNPKFSKFIEKLENKKV